ncbi:Surface polysaccharide O-acyltransferase, integral membrane enzyme [Oribacterium sp. KHPX15]|uniref:acyltransferase n=1 Tax=Oribacterium sp. KHPX15 TaxID=1855342 RepID=UPI00089D5FD5|nr:acyltransferase [Oribacterium sp. KHPX15]SEA62612.1 Surface polysaccharide O-acyltransferase, integral membrane enzyme [Oribacterium sp. KHPX15]
MNTSNTNTREYGIDLFRIILMMIIPMIHVIGQGGIINAAAPLSATYEMSWLLMSFFLVAVNCFVLITGFVHYEKETRFYRLFTLWIEVLFYSVIITIIFKFIYPDEIGLNNFWKSIIPTFYTKGQFSRYWFFTAYAGMFLLTPFINLGLKKFNKKQDIAIVVLLFVVFSFLPTILGQDYAFNLNQEYSALWFVVLYYIGGIIHKYEIIIKISACKWMLIYIICMLLSWGIRYVLEMNGIIETGFELYSFNCYLSSLNLIGAVALFCAFSKIRITQKSVISIIRFFSPVCFGVYLIHDNMTVSYYLLVNKFGFLAQQNPAMMTVGVIVIGFTIFIVCSLIDWIRELIFRRLKIKERFCRLERNFD